MKPEQPPTEEANLVQRLLAGLVAFVCRYPRSVVAVAVALCALSALASWFCLEYRTQRTDLISPDKDYQKRWREYLAEFGDDDDIVVVVQGHDRRLMKRALDTLAARVRARPDLFDRLFYKVDLRHLNNRSLLYLPAGQITEIQDNLRRMSLLLDPAQQVRDLQEGLKRLGLPLDPASLVDPLYGWKSLTVFRLLTAARTVVAKIQPRQPLTPQAEQFLTQLRAISQAALVALENPDHYQSPWLDLIAHAPAQKNLLAEPQYFFSDDGSGPAGPDGLLAFLLVRPVVDRGSFTGARQSVDALRAFVADVGPRFRGLELGLTGLPVLETDEMAASEKDTHLASCLALAGVALLFVVVYRGWRNPFLTVTTLLVGTTWAMGWTTLTVGHLNILSATFAVMLIGMGDYGVLWVTRYEQNRAAGCDVKAALRRTAVGGGPSILTAALATALAFFAAMLADFQAVAELGWIAGSGVLFCALSCFTVLPALICLFDRRPAEAADEAPPVITPVRPAAAASWLPALAARPRGVIATALGLTVVVGLCAFGLRYDHNLLHLQARGLDSVKWEMTLIEHTAGANWHALSTVGTPEEALALKEQYEKLPEVSRVVEVASLVPRGQDKKLAQLRDIRHRLRNLPARGALIPHALPATRDLKEELGSLIALLRPLAQDGPATAAELYYSLLRLRARLVARPDELAARRLRDFEQKMARSLADDLLRLRAVSTPQPITLAELPPSLSERYVGRHGQWLLRVFARECLWDHGPLRHFCRTIQRVDPQATGKPFATLEGLRSLKSGFLWAGLYALLAIVAVFLIDFRSPRYTLLALGPLVMGVVISLGIMGLCGLSLNPANMIAFPLILGVGAVYGVHVVHDYQARRTTPAYSLSYIIGRAILVMALTNMISFGTLLISRHRGLSGLGFTLMLGVTCCMLTALVFLPAVLRVLSTRRRAAVSAQQAAAEVRRAA